ncbi:MAG: NUDIX hydrolase [Lachnospiraceae bacterium]|nr:NUDIX hydrolase [Lachnospiraceae bacterium]
MVQKFQTIDRKLLRKSRVLEFYEDTLKTPDGQLVKYDMMLHKGAAAVVPVLDDGRILMVRQYRHSVDRITLEIPAGSRDSREENFRVAALRELEEETGYRSEKLEHLITIITAIAYCDEKIEVYVARDLTPTKQHLDSDEFIDVEAFELEKLKTMIFDGEIQDSKTIASIMAYSWFTKSP